MNLWNNQPLTDFIGYLGQFFFIFAVCLFAFNVLSEFIPRSSGWQKYERKMDEWRHRWMGKIKGMAQSTASVVMFSFSCLTILVFAAVRTRYPVEEWDHVAVVSRVGPNQWWMRTRSGPNSDGVLFTACPDFDNDRVIWPGYEARKIIFEEQGTCKSIRKSGLGVWWERDDKLNAKEIRK